MLINTKYSQEDLWWAVGENFDILSPYLQNYTMMSCGVNPFVLSRNRDFCPTKIVICGDMSILLNEENVVIYIGYLPKKIELSEWVDSVGQHYNHLQGNDNTMLPTVEKGTNNNDQ
jgi:hypothetical protein